MTAPLCIHELHRCTICSPVAADVPADSRPFAARHDSTCASCGFDIRTGQVVRFRRDRLVHADARGCDA